MSQNFPKPCKPFKVNINVKFDLSNYATKAVLKGAIGVHSSYLAGKFDLSVLKAGVEKVDIEKLILFLLI